MSNKKVIVVGVAGGSCSGKTVFAQTLLKELGTERAIIVAEDWYYLDQSERFDKDGGVINFDHPASLDFQMMHEHLTELMNGRAISAPTYNFTKHTRLEEVQRIMPRDIIIVDGMLLFSQADIACLLDYAVYIDASESLRLQRRLLRDVSERGRKQSGVLAQFEHHVKPMHHQFVEPYKSIATHVVTDEQSFNIVLQALINLINKK